MHVLFYITIVFVLFLLKKIHVLLVDKGRRILAIIRVLLIVAPGNKQFVAASLGRAHQRYTETDSKTKKETNYAALTVGEQTTTHCQSKRASED